MRILALVAIACVWLAAEGCTTTYTSTELDHAEPVAESVAEPFECQPLPGEESCDPDYPVCEDPDQSGCLLRNL